MAKKDSSFYVNKAQVLRNLGIEAQPVSEQTVVDVQYNEAHFNSIADSKGLSAEDFMKEVDAQAEAGSVEPPKPKSTKEFMDDIKGSTEAPKESNAKKATKSTAKKTTAPKATKADKTPVAKKEDTNVVPEVKKDAGNDNKGEGVVGHD